MAKIETPVAGYTGQIAGVLFEDGKGTTTDEGAIAYFERQGYLVNGKVGGKAGDEVKAAEDGDPGVDPAEKPIHEPSKDWTNAQLETYADAHGIEHTKGAKKDELLTAIAAAKPVDPATLVPASPDTI
jgi:hypothetical protein